MMLTPAVLDTEPHLKYILHASLEPVDAKENIIYAVICEFILQHKIPPDRFVLYPQISLPWKPDNPQDSRAEVPDFGLGHFQFGSPYFKLRIGIEAKQQLRDIMAGLPHPSCIERDPSVKSAFHALYFQGEDQAKAAIKGLNTFSSSVDPEKGTLLYLLFVGPYWTSVRYGPFLKNALGVQTHKLSGSENFIDKWTANRRLAAAPVRHVLYVLGTAESHQQLESIIGSTDGVANGIRTEAANYMCMFILFCLLIRAQ